MFSPGGVSLKLGRYKKPTLSSPAETLEVEGPCKSELTLDSEELNKLIDLLKESYNLVIEGKGEYIKASEELNPAFVGKLRYIFEHRDKVDVAKFFLENDLLPREFDVLLENRRRQNAITEFESKLNLNEVEYEWQTWFTNNAWILGGEFAEILDDRKINTQSVADYLVKDFDGFVDLIEIKRPEGNLKFWCPERDHNNLIPHNDLIKAVTQTQAYLLELEKEIDSISSRSRLNGASIIKPKATIIFGRSYNWGEEERNAFRILNTGYVNLTILTYDHVLQRAKRMVGSPLGSRETNGTKSTATTDTDYKTY